MGGFDGCKTDESTKNRVGISPGCSKYSCYGPLCSSSKIDAPPHICHIYFLLQITLATIFASLFLPQI